LGERDAVPRRAVCMGVLAKERVLFVLTFLVCAPAYAGEGLYHLSTIDYFSMKKCQENRVDPPDVWLEPGHRPPQVVVDLLEDPGERTAQRYLQWNRERLARIMAAQQAVDATQVALPAQKERGR
jgi:hypothetical protein